MRISATQLLSSPCENADDATAYSFSKHAWLTMQPEPESRAIFDPALRSAVSSVWMFSNHLRFNNRCVTPTRSAALFAHQIESSPPERKKRNKTQNPLFNEISNVSPGPRNYSGLWRIGQPVRARRAQGKEKKEEPRGHSEIRAVS